MEENKAETEKKIKEDTVGKNTAKISLFELFFDTLVRKEGKRGGAFIRLF
jgi:hypothetical protein